MREAGRHGAPVGPENARRLQARLSELEAADTLEDMRHLPGVRCHELTGDRKGQLSLSLSHPYRLIITPEDREAARKPDGGLEWTKVDAVVIEEIVDYH